MTEGIIGLIVSIIGLALAIINEFFGAQARQRLEQDAFDKRELEFSVLAQKALLSIYARTTSSGSTAGKVQDRADDFMGRKP